MRRRNELIFFGDYFEWQHAKAEENIVNHGITFEEAAEVFFFSETQYYVDEFTFFIISAWKANSSERKDYEEKRDEFKEYGF